MSDSATERVAVVNYLSDRLVGPLGGAHEVLSIAPAFYYTCGVIFPQSSSSPYESSWDSDSEHEDFGDSSPNESGDDPVRLSGQLLPSSIGISFLQNHRQLHAR